MVPEPQAATPKAKLTAPPVVRRSRAKRWPMLWTISGAVVISLLLWLGIFYAVGLVANAVIGAAS